MISLGCVTFVWNMLCHNAYVMKSPENNMDFFNQLCQKTEHDVTLLSLNSVWITCRTLHDFLCY
jgi:hypothetical protein